MRNWCVCAGCALVAFASQAIQTAGSLLVNIDAASLSGLANNATVSVWTNAGASAGWFLPVTNGVGPVYSNNVAGVPAVVFSGTVNSVMTNTVTPSASICGANDWSFEVWVHNPALATTEDVFAWTGRNMWPGGTANGSCLEFRFGTDVANAVEHYGVNLPWGGNAPSANAWHHVAVTRDAAGNRAALLGRSVADVLCAGRTQHSFGLFVHLGRCAGLRVHQQRLGLGQFLQRLGGQAAHSRRHAERERRGQQLF